jgi:transposase
MSAPGIGWVLAFTIAAEIGEISRFASPRKLSGYIRLCPRVVQSGESDRRGPLSKHGPPTALGGDRGDHARAPRPRLRGALPAHQAPAGKAAGARVAQIEIARRLAHAISHMLTHNEEFAPRGAAFRLAA